MAVEVGQRSDSADVRFVLVGHEREPQAQFREAHGSGRQIYAEQRVGEHVAFHGQGRSLAGSAPERHQLVESAEQEGS